MRASAKICIFLAGLWFGGALDHLILAVMRRTETPYGVALGIVGNWAMAAFDLGVAAACWLAYRHLARPSSLRSRPNER